MWREGRGRGRREEVMDGVRKKQAKVGGRERRRKKGREGRDRRGEKEVMDGERKTSENKR